jgi:hypothetical protein
LILHTAESLQLALDPAPAFKSQFAEAVHEIWLSAPPFPLHSDVSTHVSSSAPSVLPLHFAAMLQSSEHAAAPHSAWQSAPAVHEQSLATHMQPSPLQLGTGDAGVSSSEPQAITCSPKTMATD